MKTIYQLITEARRPDGLNYAEYTKEHPNHKKKKLSQVLNGSYGSCGVAYGYGCGGSAASSGGCGGYSSGRSGC